jgi:phosphinothricin acetyltransferase
MSGGEQGGAAVGLTVRTFEVRDVAMACALTNHFIMTTAVHFGYSPQSEAEVEAMWREGSAKYPWLAAEMHGRFAGFAKAGVWRARDAYAKTAEVTVYVEPFAQGRGVGRALYGELLARLKEAGFHTAVGGVTLPNAGSVKLHEAMGFSYVGAFREVGRKFDQWHDVGFWQRML